MFQEVPARPDYVALENEVLKLWAEGRVFEQLRAQTAGGTPWSFLDGPVTANNQLGAHHAWGRTYKDVYNRFHAMLGHELRWQQGFDCQGLWVEVEVEKELGFKSKREIEAYGVANFVNKCKERVYRFADVIAAQSKRLGYWMDWDNSYFTLSEENNYGIWGFLKTCHERGWLRRGHDVMPWCPRCGTALSEHEIATEGYAERTHLALHRRLPPARPPRRGVAGLDYHALDAARQRGRRCTPGAGVCTCVRGRRHETRDARQGDKGSKRTDKLLGGGGGIGASFSPSRVSPSRVSLARCGASPRRGARRLALRWPV